MNHLSVVRISDDRVDVRYVLDQAEIPTFRERGMSDAAVLARKRAEVAARLVLRVDGRVVALRPAGAPVLTHPPGQGGLRTTRLELPLSAPRSTRRARSSCATGRSPAASAGSPSRRCPARAPRCAPARRRPTRPAACAAIRPTCSRARATSATASFAVAPGDGTLDAGGGRVSSGGGSGGDGFAGLLDGDGVLVLLLLAAFGWGALHALSPGHGKAMVAAYLVGTRGSTRDALLLGATVTVTHTAGVIALGVVALGLSAWILPEQLYPWLTLLSGALVVGVGVSVLRGRLRGLGHRHPHGPHDHAHGPHEHDTTTRTSRRRGRRGAACSRSARRRGSSRARPRSSSCSARWRSTGSGSGSS